MSRWRWSGARRRRAAVHPSVQHAFANSPTGMAIATIEGRLSAVNPALVRLLARAPGALLGHRLVELTAPGDQDGLRRQLLALGLGDVASSRHQTRLMEGDGTTFDAMVSAVTVFDDQGRPDHLVVQFDDVSEYTREVAQMRERALHDPLTGLANRTLFTDRLDHAFASHRREGWPLTLLFADLDGFKTVNDRYGHSVGDEVLVAVGARLLDGVRSADTVARMGGDEFAVLCERTSAADAEHVVERVHQAVAQPVIVGDMRLTVTASVGMQTSHAGNDDPRQLLQRADAAMYEHKRSRALRTA